MKATKLWLAAFVLVAPAACTEQGGNNAELGADSATSRPGDTASVTAPQPTPADSVRAQQQLAAGQRQVQLLAVGGSGASGTAHLIPVGDSVQVVLNLGGLQRPGAHAAHIHEGTCDSPGSPVAPLQEVNTGSGQGGSSTTMVPMSMLTVMDGRHIVAVHEGAGSSPGAMVVCGQIPPHNLQG